MPVSKEKKKKQQRMLLQIIIFVFVPSAFILIGLTLFDLTSPKDERYIPQQKVSIDSLQGNSPSDILAQVLGYENQIIQVKGRVVYSPSVCDQEKSCAKDAPCCGCAASRDLIIKDESTKLLTQSSEIRLYNPGKGVLCAKNENSCDYSCGDWVVGGLYELTGTFILIRPPGLTTSRGYLEFYLEVSDKKRIPEPTPAQKNQNVIEKMIERFVVPIVQNSKV